MGFLGAGKTSFINDCIKAFRQDSRWAILVNEAGQIGIDEKLYQAASGIAIKQVAGGCICCTSQLPLQIALVRLLSEHHPQRLWIEPTGLAHPQTLIEQLSAPHWQTALSLKSAISIVNARQWLQPRYREHDGYQAHVRFCDVIVINRFNGLNANDMLSLKQWLEQLNPAASVIWQTTSFDRQLQHELWACLNKLSQVLQDHQHYRQISLVHHTPISSPTVTTQPDPEIPTVLPFRYHDKYANYAVMGWRLPAHWQVDMVGLMDWLLKLPNWQRIKSIVHTTQGWQILNFTPDSLDMVSSEAQLDNRIEVIFLTPDVAIDFDLLDAALIALFDSQV